MSDVQDLPAGAFSSWIARTLRAQVSGAGADVPCGTCTACCRSSYFIHIGPDETTTLRRIPRSLLFPAPGLPEGNVVMGYDERGHCPMLVDGACSIYDDRPRTCRDFDCRVFAAAGVAPEEDGKHLIGVQVRRWQFDFANELDRGRHEAVQAAAAFLRGHAECFPDGKVPTSSSELAVLAIKAHHLFLDRGAASGSAEVVTPDPETVSAVLRRSSSTSRGNSTGGRDVERS